MIFYPGFLFPSLPLISHTTPGSSELSGRLGVALPFGADTCSAENRRGVLALHCIALHDFSFPDFGMAPDHAVRHNKSLPSLASQGQRIPLLSSILWHDGNMDDYSEI